MQKPSALIVNKDEHLCRWLKQILISWRMSAKNIVNPCTVLDDIKKHHYNVILFDVCTSDGAETELLGSVRELCPQTKIISLVNQTDTTRIVKVLQGGAFDFLAKPISLELLRHVVMRALDTQRMELEQKKLYKEIASNQKILTEISDALSEMTRAVETIRRVTETRMIRQMRSLLLPLVENLRQDKQLQIYEPSLTQLLHLIDDIHAGFPTNLPASPSLSVRELRTALMIKNGMTNQEIASHLHIALETVKAHRRNIRKKLGITGTKCTLGAYLQALDDDGTPGTES